MILDYRVSDAAHRTHELLLLLGARAERMIQAEIAVLRGVSVRELRRHLRALERTFLSASYNTIRTRTKSFRGRRGKAEVQEVPKDAMVEIRFVGHMERCKREGRDPFECAGGWCYDRLVEVQGGKVSPLARQGAPWSAFACGSPECYRLLAEAGKREPLTPCHVSELELLHR